MEDTMPIAEWVKIISGLGTFASVAVAIVVSGRGGTPISRVGASAKTFADFGVNWGMNSTRGSWTT